jgi:dienelactone hydrolase
VNKYKYLLIIWAFCSSCVLAAGLPETVHFPSADGKTTLTGYMFRPAGSGPHPAVVMMHGRAGPYSTLRPGQYDNANLTARHRLWGQFWAERGYLALHVDSFGPRGYPAGFGKHSYGSRPPEVSEQSVRPYDAYGALAYLRSREDVDRQRIGLQGWSNGGMAVLATLAPRPPGPSDPTPESGFRAAIASYPSCRFQEKQEDYRPYAPLLLMVAGDDDEVSPVVCRRFNEQIKRRGATVEFIWFEEAQHSFDDPGKRKQSHAPNRDALKGALDAAARFFDRHLAAR